jgi:hypothetical protein
MNEDETDDKLMMNDPAVTIFNKLQGVSTLLN